MGCPPLCFPFGSAAFWVTIVLCFAELFVSRYELCTGCGKCEVVCPVWRAFRREELGPRGWMRILQGMGEARYPDALQPFLSACIGCGACVSVCPAGVVVMEEIMGRRRVGRNMLGRVKVRHSRGGVVLFVGCSAARVAGLVEAAVAHARAVFGDVEVLSGCCGAPFEKRGRKRLAEAFINAIAVASRKAEKILTICPHCYAALRKAKGRGRIKADVVWFCGVVRGVAPAGVDVVWHLRGCATAGQELPSPLEGVDLKVVPIESCCGNPPGVKKELPFEVVMGAVVSECPRCVERLLERGLSAVHVLQFLHSGTK